SSRCARRCSASSTATNARFRRRWSMFRLGSGGHAVKPGKVYGAPGDGNSLYISIATAVVLIGIWVLVTGAGWVRPLFLPSPFAVYNKFVIALNDGVANSTLVEHTRASLMRVFGAFFLACATAIPIGIWMGV